MVAEEAFVPHTPDPKLLGTAIVYAVRLDFFGKMSKKDQQRLIDANPQANKQEGPGEVTKPSRRAPGVGAEKPRPSARRQGDDSCPSSGARLWSD